MLTPPRRPLPPTDDDHDERYADERVNRRARPFVGYFAVAVGLAYVAVGVAVLVLPAGRLPLPPVARYLLAAILLLYGSWRAWRAVGRYFR